MAKTIFETSFLGAKVSVYTDRVVYRPLWFAGEQSIPINSIASVDVAMPGLQQVIVETTGGKKIKMVVMIGKKDKVRDAIYQAMQMK